MHSPRWLSFATVAILVAAGLAGCGAPQRLALLTDPHEIVTAAATSSAALGSVHVQIDLAGQNSDAAGRQDQIRFLIAAEIDVQGRNLGGRLQMTQGNQPGNPAETSEFLVVGGKTFTRQTTSPRWSVQDNGGKGAHLPSNAEYLALIEAAITNGSATLGLADAVDCGGGKCYHVTASLDEAATWALLVAPLVGEKVDPGGVPQLEVTPSTLDIYVDQATRMLSGINLAFSVQRNAVSVAIAFSNHDAPIRIAAPPLDLVDGLNGGGVQPVPTPAPQPVPAESAP